MRVLLDEDVASQSLEPLQRVLRNHQVHHVRYGRRYDLGLTGLALALGALIAAMPLVMADLARVTGQRLVRINGLDPRARHEVVDPAKSPPRYWPR
jgi:hypothetical protein